MREKPLPKDVFCDLEEKKLIEFDRVDLETYNLDSQQ